MRNITILMILLPFVTFQAPGNGREGISRDSLPAHPPVAAAKGAPSGYYHHNPSFLKPASDSVVRLKTAAATKAAGSNKFTVVSTDSAINQKAKTPLFEIISKH